MNNPRQVTNIQAAAILSSTIVGVGVLRLPLYGVKVADTGAPLITLLGALLGLIGLTFIAVLGMRFPSKTFIQYSEEIIGKWPAALGNIAIIIFFALLTALGSREFGEVVITSVLKKTPIEVTVIVMLLLATIASRNDIRTFSYIHLFYLPFILAPGLLIVALSLKNADLINLQPIWGNHPSGVLNGILTLSALFQGSFILTMIIPFMRRPQKAMKASLWGMGIATGLYLSIVVASVAVFGAEEINKLLWPTLELAKTTSLPANILERLDAAFLAVWVTAVFTTLFSSFYLTIQSITQIFRLHTHKMLSYFLLPFITTIAMLPQNVIQLYEIINIVGRIGLCITIVYPGLLLVISIIWKKRSD
ncbi:GerAB/ArcD/ProY family transporter [Paenibacillus sp. FSL H8-0034]|uniref:GerAB/ArcD/ProY family transporter n=1 Tax=Paenibacillus sp. FSL H8-0034 TaxID=2954671 RepID=UPI0030FBFB78